MDEEKAVVATEYSKDQSGVVVGSIRELFTRRSMAAQAAFAAPRRHAL